MMSKDAILDYLAGLYSRFRLRKRQVSFESYLAGFVYSKKLSRDTVKKFDLATRIVFEIGIYGKIINFRLFHLSRIQKFFLSRRRHRLPDEDFTKEVNLFQFSHLKIFANLMLLCWFGSAAGICFEFKNKFRKLTVSLIRILYINCCLFLISLRNLLSMIFQRLFNWY